MDWKTLFFSADGRISRQTFWIAVLILFGANAIGHWLPFIGFLIWAASIYCAVCINAKRLHDMGRSGWTQAWVWGLMAVLMVFGTAVGGTAMMAGWTGGYPGHMGPSMMNGVGWGGLGLLAATGGVTCLIGLVFLLWIGLTPGQAGANKYGEPPAATPLAAA